MWVLILRDAIEGGVVVGPRMTTGGNVLINCVGGTASRLLPDVGTRGYARIVHTPGEIVTEIHRQIKLWCRLDQGSREWLTYSTWANNWRDTNLVSRRAEASVRYRA